MEFLNNIKLKIEDYKKDAFSLIFDAEIAKLNGNYKKALALCNKSIAKAIKNNENQYLNLYYSSRAEIEKYLKNYNAALADIEKAIELQPNVYLYYFLRSEIKELLGNKDGANDDLKIIYNLLDKNDSTHIFIIYLARKKIKEGCYQDAGELLKDTFSNVKYNTEEVLTLKLELYSNLKDYDNLFTTLNNLIAMYPRRVNYYKFKASLLKELNREEEAKEVLNQIKEIS